MSYHQLTTLYLVRHGETDWNRAGILQGQDDSPLTAKGLEQAKQIGRNFENIAFDAVYSSDIGRAKTTAEIIAQHARLPVQTSVLIRERYFGSFQGKSASLVNQKLRQRILKSSQLSKPARLRYKLADDIESDHEVISRFEKFLRIIHAKYAGKRLLVVSHGALMRILLIYIDFARYGQLGFHSIDNLGYFVVHTDGQSIDLIKCRGVHLTNQA